MPNLPLEGIRVIDLSTAYSAPIGTMQLADFGAEVIKVENTSIGDPSRTWSPLHNGQSIQFLNMNRNKKSVTLNLKAEEGRALLYELVKTADVVVENFRPGVAKRLGCGYEALCAVKPDIIMASLSGFGQTGPKSTNAAYSNIAEASSGLMHVTGYPNGKPTASGVAFGDSVAGMFLTQGILYALFHRERTGEGQYIDISMTDSLFHLIMQGVIQKSLMGVDPGRIGCRDLSAYPYDIFQAKDGYCILGVSTVNDWRPFAQAIERPELAEDPRFDTNEHRVENADELSPYIERWTLAHTRAEIEQVFLTHKLAFASVLTVGEAMEDEQLRHREMVVDMEYEGMGRYQMQGIPVKLSKTPGQVRMGCPHQGEHNEEIYGGLGLSQERLAQLKRDGVI